MKCRAHLITIGDEILIGQVVDTNASHIAASLTAAGVSVVGKTCIGDRADEILAALNRLWKQNDLLVITGGLGPTNDDITKKTLLRFFNDTLVHHGPTLDHIRQLFRSFGREINDAQYGQAMLPSTCRVLKNVLGTAPGMWFEREGRVMISLPGVPYEMKGILEKEALPLITSHFDLPFISQKTLLTMGLGESYIAEKIKHVEDQLSSDVSLAYLPHVSGVRLRVSCTGNRLEATEKVEQVINQMEEILSHWAFGYNEETLAGAVLKKCRELNVHISTAESCTGGYMAQLITGVPGASAHYKGSIIAYDEECKVSLLGIPQEMINTFGVVSKETAEAMAAAVARLTGAHMGIATTGVAGPSGGTEENPVGTVWIAIWYKGKIHSKRWQLGEQRSRVIERASLTGLMEAYRILNTHHT